MGQGLEPLTADLCLSSRSQPPQLPSRTDFFEQSKKKNVSRVAAKRTTTAARLQQQQQQLLQLPLQRVPSGRSRAATLGSDTRNRYKPETGQLPRVGSIRPKAHDTRLTLLSMLPDFPSNAHMMEFG